MIPQRRSTNRQAGSPVRSHRCRPTQATRSAIRTRIPVFTRRISRWSARFSASGSGVSEASGSVSVSVSSNSALDTVSAAPRLSSAPSSRSSASADTEKSLHRATHLRYQVSPPQAPKARSPDGIPPTPGPAVPGCIPALSGAGTASPEMSWETPPFAAMEPPAGAILNRIRLELPQLEVEMAPARHSKPPRPFHRDASHKWDASRDQVSKSIDFTSKRQFRALKSAKQEKHFSFTPGQA